MTDKKKNRIRKILIGAAVLAGGLIYAVFGIRGQDTVLLDRDISDQEESAGVTLSVTEKEIPAETEESESTDISVHVCGAVREPDHVYVLPAGSRVEDAVNAAGGAEPDAALWRINLAAPLSDGQRIYIPEEGEESGLQDLVSINIITEESSGTHLTDLNKASKIELEDLPGIGPALAGRIIAYREENGGFSDVEELLNVKGIGEVLLSRLRSLVTAGNPGT
ncbi:MAG: helix-hairpin-helix domain-containing protein [Firmicutes bacterium]|nr:helix-hairpin-helix domain-containing protein [Bacillota bacterium]